MLPEKVKVLPEKGKIRESVNRKKKNKGKCYQKIEKYGKVFTEERFSLTGL